MSGVNILPKARTGQLPLALAERPLDRNGARQGPPALLRVHREATTVRHDVQGLMGLTARGGGRPWFAWTELFVGPITSSVGHFRHASEQSLEAIGKVMTTSRTGPGSNSCSSRSRVHTHLDIGSNRGLENKKSPR